MIAAMNHHSFTKHCSADLFNVLYTLVRHEFPGPDQLQDLLDRIDWEQEDLEAWIHNAGDRLIDEAFTFLLHALSFPGAGGGGPRLPEMTETSEVERTLPHIWEQTRDTTGSNSLVTDETDDEPESPEEGDTAALRLLSLMRRTKLALLDAGIIRWDDLAADQRKLEAEYRRLGHGRFPTVDGDAS